jgi:HD-GYP domain-containing protein (c-di-GMP phosphodiesterase class II)
MAELNSVQTQVTDLEVGMYVSALDRPWMDTPFLVQGFYIISQQDIEELERHCKFVYVDVYRSKVSPSRRNSRIVGTVGVSKPWLSDVQPAVVDVKFKPRTGDAAKILFPHRTLRKYDDSADLQQELVKAKSVHSDLSSAVGDMMERFRHGGALELSGIRHAVDPMVESVVRNPDACVWLARLKTESTYAYHHSVGASIWAVALGRHLGLPKVDLQRLGLGALLFDVGKLKIPPELLQKRERLSRGEFELLKSHVQFGMEMLQNTGVLNRTVSDMVESHHERHSGNGYPRGLKGEEIPVFARIAAIVDCYDAITSRRPYSNPLSPSAAVKKLYAWRDVDFQAELVEEFIQAIGIYPAGTLVELSNGEVGVVLSEYRTRRLRPRLLMVLDREKRPLAEPRPLDLRAATHDDEGKPLEISTSLEPGAYGVDPEALLI